MYFVLYASVFVLEAHSKFLTFQAFNMVIKLNRKYAAIIVLMHGLNFQHHAPVFRLVNFPFHAYSSPTMRKNGTRPLWMLLKNALIFACSSSVVKPTSAAACSHAVSMAWRCSLLKSCGCGLAAACCGLNDVDLATEQGARRFIPLSRAAAITQATAPVKRKSGMKLY